MKFCPIVERLEDRLVLDAVPVGYIIGPFAIGFYPTQYRQDPEMTLPDLASTTLPDFNTFDAIEQYTHGLAMDQPLTGAPPEDPLPPAPSDISGPTQYQDLYQPGASDSTLVPDIMSNARQDQFMGGDTPTAEAAQLNLIGGLRDSGQANMRLAVRDMMENFYNWAMDSSRQMEAQATQHRTRRDVLRQNQDVDGAYREDCRVAFYQAQALRYRTIAYRNDAWRQVALDQVISDANQEYAQAVQEAAEAQFDANDLYRRWSTQDPTLPGGRVSTWLYNDMVGFQIPAAVYLRNLAARTQAIAERYQQ